MRKPSPISTSWPRETTISRPAASAASTSSSAAALLFTQSAASAPVSSPTAARRGSAACRARRWRGRARGWRSRPRRPHALERGVRERRAAEVRVQDDAGGVDHRAQRGSAAAARGGDHVGGAAAGARAARTASRSAASASRTHSACGASHAASRTSRSTDGSGLATFRIVRRSRTGEVVAQTRGTLPFWAGAATFVPRAGARPRQRHAGARILSVDDAAREHGRCGCMAGRAACARAVGAC